MTAGKGCSSRLEASKYLALYTFYFIFFFFFPLTKVRWRSCKSSLLKFQVCRSVQGVQAFIFASLDTLLFYTKAYSIWVVIWKYCVTSKFVSVSLVVKVLSCSPQFMLFKTFKHVLLPKCKRPWCHLRMNNKNVVLQVNEQNLQP